MRYLRSTMVAGIVLACHATLATRQLARFAFLSVIPVGNLLLVSRTNLATRNIRHFHDLSVPVIDPLAPQGMRSKNAAVADKP